MEELCIDGSRRRVVAWAKCIQDDLKIQLRVYRTNRNQTCRHSNYTASLHSLWVTYHCFPDRGCSKVKCQPVKSVPQPTHTLPRRHSARGRYLGKTSPRDKQRAGCLDVGRVLRSPRTRPTKRCTTLFAGRSQRLEIMHPECFTQNSSVPNVQP